MAVSEYEIRFYGSEVITLVVMLPNGPLFFPVSGSKSPAAVSESKGWCMVSRRRLCTPSEAVVIPIPKSTDGKLGPLYSTLQRTSQVQIPLMIVRATPLKAGSLSSPSVLVGTQIPLLDCNPGDINNYLNAGRCCSRNFISSSCSLAHILSW